MSIVRFLIILSLCFALVTAQRFTFPGSVRPAKPQTPQYKPADKPPGANPGPKPPNVPNGDAKPEVVNTNMRQMNQRLGDIVDYAKAATDLASAILATTTKPAASTSTRRSAGSVTSNQPRPTNINTADFEPCRTFANRLNTCAQSKTGNTFYDLSYTEQASCACYSNTTESCIVTRTRDANFDENSYKCQQIFMNNGYEAISDLMLGQYWVGGTEFCALVNQYGNADIEDDRAVSSATAKGSTYLEQTMKATSASGCVATKAAASSPTPSSSGNSGALSKGSSGVLSICALIALISFSR